MGGKLLILKEFVVFPILSYELLDERQLVCYPRSGIFSLRNSVVAF